MNFFLLLIVPPVITRYPKDDIIVVDEGSKVTITCLSEGIPKPKLTWTKKGKLPAHVRINDEKSTLELERVDDTYSDSYSCMAMNGVGDPVSSEFQIYVKCNLKAFFFIFIVFLL